MHNIFHILLLKKAVVNKEIGKVIYNKIIIKGKKLKYKVK